MQRNHLSLVRVFGVTVWQGHKNNDDDQTVISDMHTIQLIEKSKRPSMRRRKLYSPQSFMRYSNEANLSTIYFWARHLHASCTLLRCDLMHYFFSETIRQQQKRTDIFTFYVQCAKTNYHRLARKLSAL